MADEINSSIQSTPTGSAAPVTAAPAAPAAQPVAAPAAPAAPAFTVIPSASSSAPSGGGGDDFMEILKNLNWVEILFGALGVYAIFTVADFYRNNRIKVNPSITELQNQFDKITIELADVKTALQNKIEQQNTPNTQGFY